MKNRIASFWRLLRRKMVRDPLPPERVAGGWALGMFIGCAIPFGFQLIISVPLAMLLRVSKIGASVGTFITNPLTILVIYPFQTWAANAILFGGSLSFERLMEVEWTFDSVRQLGTEAMKSFFAGGIALALVLSPLTYFFVLRIVTAYRLRRGQYAALAKDGRQT